MKSLHHRLGGALVFGATALVFLVADAYGVVPGGDWAVLPAVLAQLLSLTIVVGTWVFAMAFLEAEEDAPGAGEASTGHAASS
jgi:hypothetical protein